MGRLIDFQMARASVRRKSHVSGKSAPDGKTEIIKFRPKTGKKQRTWDFAWNIHETKL